MLKLRVLGLLTAAVCASLIVVSCGDDDDGDGGTSADEQEITDAITASATTNDRRNCTELQTQRFVEQTTGETGEEALKSCQEEGGESVADDAEVSSIEIDGDSATADAALSGSFFGGQTIEIGLVKEGDQWKLDELLGFVDLDLQALANAIGTSLEEEEDAPAEVTDCVVGNITELSDEDAEALLINNDRQLEQQVFDACFEGQGG
jgi:hypothetical protein